MKTSRLYRFCLMMMMVMLVYTASVRVTHTRNETKSLLKDIHQIAEYLLTLNKTVLPDIMVTKGYKHARKCQPEFFCLAEKTLTTMHGHEMSSLSKLTRLLHSYNNMTGSVTCSLVHNSTYRRRQFLKDVKDCVEHALNKTVLGNSSNKTGP